MLSMAFKGNRRRHRFVNFDEFERFQGGAKMARVLVVRSPVTHARGVVKTSCRSSIVALCHARDKFAMRWVMDCRKGEEPRRKWKIQGHWNGAAPGSIPSWRIQQCCTVYVGDGWLGGLGSCGRRRVYACWNHLVYDEQYCCDVPSCGDGVISSGLANDGKPPHCLQDGRVRGL